MNKYITKILISFGFIVIFFISNVSSASALTFSRNYTSNTINCDSSSWTIPVGCLNNNNYSNNNSFDVNNNGYNPNDPNNNPNYNNNGYNPNDPNNNPNYNNSNGNGQVSYNNNPGKPVINNYYYPGSNTPTIKKRISSNTITTKNTTTKSTTPKSTKTDSTKKVVATNFNPNLTNNGLSALAINTSKTTSNGFLPHTFWQWLVVIFLILIIVILIRMISRAGYKNKIYTNPAH